MAKVTDLNEVLNEIFKQLEEYPSSLEDFLGTERTALVVLTIYNNMDSQKAVGQDFEDILSVIASPSRISVIGGNHASFYKSKGNYITYETLEDDIANTLIILDAAVERWRYNLG